MAFNTEHSGDCNKAWLNACTVLVLIWLQSGLQQMMRQGRRFSSFHWVILTKCRMCKTLLLKCWLDQKLAGYCLLKFE